MMFMTPLAVYLRKKSPEEIDAIVRDVTELIHPDEIVKLCNIFYVVCMVHLINGKSRQEAYESVKVYIQKYNQTPELTQWLSEIENPKTRVVANRKGGWIRIAFTYSFSIFLENKPFEESMKEMLLFGGDTDTNCCIMGGLLGASEGTDHIPK